jgi:hypothetical protein
VEQHQVEWCFALDVGILSGRWVTPGDEGPLYLRAAACAWSIEAAYMVRNDGRLVLTVWLPTETSIVQSDIELTMVPMVSGGDRAYFLCPGLPGARGCGARVAMLYWPLIGGQGFACRRCHRLAYRSTQERRKTLAQLRQEILGRPWPILPAAPRRPASPRSFRETRVS